jgi:polyphosphate kinase 2 (PPK2 family)
MSIQAIHLNSPRKKTNPEPKKRSPPEFWPSSNYEEMIRETATKDAPWYVVPADNKWFTRVVVATAVIEALADLHLAYPEVGEDKLKELAAAKKKLLNK